MTEDPLARFDRLVGESGSPCPLDEAALCVAACLQPEAVVDVDEQLTHLDQLAAGVTEPTLGGLRHLLFTELGFEGHEDDYEDARSSFLDQVLDRRRGLPITLSLVMIEVGRRVGVPLAPVGMPGHFVVRDAVDPDVFIDPFNRGALLDADSCRSILERLYPRLQFEERYLAAVPPRSVMLRLLANLSGLYRRHGDRSGLTRVLELRSRLGIGETEQRELALLLAAGGRYAEAARRLEAIGGRDDSHTAARLRARLN